MADSPATCPQCGAATRPAQDWCTLCLHVLRAPEPAPVAAAAAVEPGETTHIDHPGALEPTRAGAPRAGAADPDFDVEAAASALLSQLAIDTKGDSFAVPALLNSKARIAVFVTVAMVVLCGVSLATMAVLGKLFG